MVPNAVAHIFVAQLTSGIIGTEREAVSTNAPDSGNVFRFDPAGGQYIFNLGTKQLSPGTWRIRVVLTDGLSHTAFVSLTAK